MTLLSHDQAKLKDDFGHSRNEARLVVSCIDRPGIVAAVSGFLARHGANIIHSDQHSTGVSGGQFFLRVEFYLDSLDSRLDSLDTEFAEEVARAFGAEYRMRAASGATRVAIMVSKYDHCLLDLLWRARRRELPVEITQVISNHRDLEQDVASFGVPYVYIPVTKDTKAEAENRELDVLRGNVDLVVLARYMQVLSADFLNRVGVPVINIHHSFLPAFSGAGPYLQAKERGVKIIGATAHYATQDLDEGPIIEQDVARISHRASVEELTRKGSDIERIVLARAVEWHCEDRVLRNGRSTIVF